MKFTTREAQIVLGKNVGRILINSLNVKPVSRKMVSSYRQQLHWKSNKVIDVRQQTWQFDVDECIAYYDELLKQDNINHVREGVTLNLERLNEMKSYLSTPI